MFQELIDLWKAKSHKYTHKKRVYVKGKPSWRYYYKEHHGGGVTKVDELHVGEAFKVNYKGKEGHFHIQEIKDDKVKVVHDETGKETTLTRAELKAVLKSTHAQALKENVKKKEQSLKEAQSGGKMLQVNAKRRLEQAREQLGEEAPKKEAKDVITEEDYKALKKDDILKITYKDRIQGEVEKLFRVGGGSRAGDYKRKALYELDGNLETSSRSDYRLEWAYALDGKVIFEEKLDDSMLRSSGVATTTVKDVVKFEKVKYNTLYQEKLERDIKAFETPKGKALIEKIKQGKEVKIEDLSAMSQQIQDLAELADLEDIPTKLERVFVFTILDEDAPTDKRIEAVEKYNDLHADVLRQVKEEMGLEAPKKEANELLNKPKKQESESVAKDTQLTSFDFKKLDLEQKLDVAQSLFKPAQFVLLKELESYKDSDAPLSQLVEDLGKSEKEIKKLISSLKRKKDKDGFSFIETDRSLYGDEIYVELDRDYFNDYLDNNYKAKEPTQEYLQQRILDYLNSTTAEKKQLGYVGWHIIGSDFKYAPAVKRALEDLVKRGKIKETEIRESSHPRADSKTMLEVVKDNKGAK